MKKALLIVAGLVGAVVVVGLVVGALLPREHVARSTIVVPATADSVWPMIRDFERVAGWWTDLERVERIADPAGQDREVWREHMTQGAMDMAVERSEPPAILVTRIVADADAAFGGIWTWQLEPLGDSTRVTITEAGYINSKVFRFLAHTIFSLHGTVDSYLTDLAAHLGSDAVPEHVE